MYTAYYEVLRTQMTGAGEPTGPSRLGIPGVGLAVLLQQGLPAWLDAVDDLTASSARDGAPSPGACVDSGPMLRATDGRRASPLAPDLVPVAQQPEITRLLAALVLSTVRSSRGATPASCGRDGEAS